jgi:hypothetical protein
MGDPVPIDSSEIVDEKILRRLAAAVILSAMRDAAGGSFLSKKRSQEARAWLLDEENQFPWFELARIERKHMLVWFEAGCKNPKEFKLEGKYKKDPKRKRYCNYELKAEPPGENAPIDPDLGIEY